MGDRALEERLKATRQETMGQYCGASAVANFGDAVAEFAALRSGCGLASLTWRKRFRLTGADRVRWLNGMVTNNIRDLEVARGVYAFFLNPQGRIQGDMIAWNRGDDLLIETDAWQEARLRTAFDKYIIMDEVEIADAEPVTKLGVAGPEAINVLGAALDGAGKAAELGLLQFQASECHGKQLTIARGDLAPISDYQLWLPTGLAGDVWKALTAAGARPVGFEALELLRIWLGRPLYGVDITERDLPQETAQQRALNFSKGCYVGQEIVERIRSRGQVHRVFAQFAVEGAPPERAAKITSGGKDVGEVTGAARIPAANGEATETVALGYIRREALESGTELRIGEASAKPRPPVRELAETRK